MSPNPSPSFQQEILKGQPIPEDLLALLGAGEPADDDSLREALNHSLLIPRRDYPLLTGSYLNDVDRQNPDIMANVAAINDVISLITFVAESDDGDMIGYWHGPERTPIGSAPIVKLDTEGQFDLMPGQTLAEAMLGHYTYGDDERFVAGRDWLASHGIVVNATNWHELSTPVAATRPNQLHKALYNEKRIAAGLKPVR
jgi:hypothetical protein